MNKKVKKIKVVVTGATGRMGQMLVKQILADENLSLFGVTERPHHKKIGFDINITNKFDDNTKQVIKAFQRHWRSSRVDGFIDISTKYILFDISNQFDNVRLT